MQRLANLNEIRSLVHLGAMFYVSHSAGKDSQAMYTAIAELVPHHQIRVVHADLGFLEHEGTLEHIKRTISPNHLGNLIIAKARNQAGDDVDLFDMIRNRRRALDLVGRRDAPAFPSSAQRYCTSDLKTGPIWREIRNAGNHEIVVNCVGIRADESRSRARKVVKRGTLQLNKKNTNGKRDAYDWWPIAHWSEDDVWRKILGTGQQPHPAYGLESWHDPIAGEWTYEVTGNERLSCVFCIFGSPADLARGRQAKPELYQAFGELEIEVRGTMFNGESLAERIARA